MVRMVVGICYFFFLSSGIVADDRIIAAVNVVLVHLVNTGFELGSVNTSGRRNNEWNQIFVRTTPCMVFP